MNFSAFEKDILQNRWQVHGAEVYENGVLTHSFGDTTGGRYPIYSATKTVLSIAAGMAWDMGKIDFSRCVLDYLPESRICRLNADQLQGWKKISLHRLMCMSVAGLPFRAEGESWLDFALQCPLQNPEKPVFNYSNISAYLVGVALSHALDTDLAAFIQSKLLLPLGIENAFLTRCPDGYFYGASGMELSVHDLSQIGLMLFGGGVYSGKRILSEKYVRLAASVQQMNREGGYGYFLWKYRSGFSINGKWKQKCYILPRDGLVITYLANMPDPDPALKMSMEKHLLGITE